MTTKDEALKLALEALDEAIKMWREEMEYRSCIDAADSWEKTSTAIKQALAAPYVASQLVQEPVAWMEMVVANLVREGVNKHKARKLAQHFYTAPPAAPVQEPDSSHPKIQALIGADARNRITIDLIWRILENQNGEYTASDMEYWDAIHDAVQAAAQPALNPLTDEQIEQIYLRYGGEMINCTRAIERAHGIKGAA